VFITQQITQMTDITAAESVFHIRDLGSAGGTFIRIPHGKRKQLHPGTHPVLAVSCDAVAEWELDACHTVLPVPTSCVSFDAAPLVSSYVLLD
jgi:hypothetical protein